MQRTKKPLVSEAPLGNTGNQHQISCRTSRTKVNYAMSNSKHIKPQAAFSHY